MSESTAASADGDSVSLNVGVNTDFVAEFDRVARQIQDELHSASAATREIEGLTLALERCHDTGAAQRIQGEMEDSVKRSTASISQSQKLLKAIRDKGLEKERAGDYAEAQLVLPRCKALCRQHMEVVAQNQEAKATFKRCKMQQLIRVGRVVPSLRELSAEELERRLEENPDLISQAMQGRTVHSRARAELEDAREYQREIRDLVRSIHEVSQMSKDIAELVQQQGELVDRIAGNVSDSKNYVKEGNRHIESAIEYQKKSRKRMCCLACIFMVVLLFLSGLLGGVLS